MPPLYSSVSLHFADVAGKDVLRDSDAAPDTPSGDTDWWDIGVSMVFFFLKTSFHLQLGQMDSQMLLAQLLCI